MFLGISEYVDPGQVVSQAGRGEMAVPLEEQDLRDATNSIARKKKRSLISRSPIIRLGTSGLADLSSLTEARSHRDLGGLRQRVWQFSHWSDRYHISIAFDNFAFFRPQGDEKRTHERTELVNA
jgi:hypothetical protein